MKKPIPEEVLDYFRQQGAKGGKIGGTRRAANMTASQRKASATKASQAAAVARSKKAKTKKKAQP